MTISLYFGPYNDPGDATLTHHWDFPHAPDFHNPAFTITRTVNPDHSVALSISLAVRNITGATVNADFVKLYAAACGLINTATDVNLLASTVITNLGTSPIHQWSVLLGDSMAVPPRSIIADDFWSPPSGPVLWTVPPYASGFIIIALLQAPGQVVQNNPTGDPSVAIWLG